MTASGTLVISRRKARWRRWMMYQTRRGMSSRRSRKGRHADRKHVEPVQKIRPELAGGGHLLEIAVGCRDEADVNPAGLRRSQPLELPLLEHAQQLGLQLQWQIADFVEEERALVGDLEASVAGIHARR